LNSGGCEHDIVLNLTRGWPDGAAWPLVPAGSALAVIQRGNNREAAFLYAFDLIEMDGKDLRRLPIEPRKQRLAQLLSPSL